MSGIAWKIGTFSAQQLESALTDCYYAAGPFEPPTETNRDGSLTTLGKLWAEFDARIAAGAMTDDEEGLLNDTRKY